MSRSDAVEQVVGNGFCHGGWWRWVEEGYIVVGFGWARVGVRGFAVGAHIAGAWWFIHDGGDWDGSAEADGKVGVHFVDRGGVGADTAGEGSWGGCHGGPVGCCGRRCVDKPVGCGY